MLSSARHHRYTYSEYLALEEHANVRHEFFDGEIYAMTGGTPELLLDLYAKRVRLFGYRTIKFE